MLTDWFFYICNLKKRLFFTCSATLLAFLVELLKSSVAMQEQMLGGKGFLVIGYLLEKVCLGVGFFCLCSYYFCCHCGIFNHLAQRTGGIKCICDIRYFWFVIFISCVQESFHPPYPLICLYSKNQFSRVDPVCLIYAFTLDLFVNHFNVFSFVFLHSLSPKLSFRKVLLFPVCMSMSRTCHNLGLNFFFCVC